MPPILMDNPHTPRGFCISCGYSLQGLAAGEADSTGAKCRCPECGRAFDPADPKTFHIHQHSRVVRWLAGPPGWPAVILSLAAAAGVLLVSRWKVRTFAPSVVDLLYFLNPAALRHRTNLTTQNDYAFVLSVIAALAAAAWWVTRTVVRIGVRWAIGSPREERVTHAGRRSALITIGLLLTSAGVVLGWPYRLAQQWTARRTAIVTTPSWLVIWTDPPPGDLSELELLTTLRAAVMQLPRPTQKMTGLQLLIEEYPESALPILVDAVSAEPDPEVRALELRLIGLHRDPDTVNLLRGFLTHADAPTRAAAADAVGLVHAPAFDVPLTGEDSWWAGPNATKGRVQISLGRLKPYLPLFSHRALAELKNVAPFDAGVRSTLERMMLEGPSSEEREAAARALLTWPPDVYALRVAEWGVWINVAGELKLTKSVLDEIPPFVHRTGNPLAEFSGRVRQMGIITKPIIHITVDRPMAVDVSVSIHRGRPWFAYPRPDDFSVRVETTMPRNGTYPPTPFLAPLDNPSLPPLTDIRQGYPWLMPEHIGVIAGGWPGETELTSLGLRWQSVIVSPTRLPWMTPPATGPDKRFAWWGALREVPSAWLSSRGESERFLYYDGPTLLPSPVKISLAGDELRITRKTGTDPSGILVVRRRAGRLSGQAVAFGTGLNADPHPEITYKLAADDLHEAQVIDAFQHMLVTAGLTAPEAAGLIAAWTQQFFQTDGTRVLFLMPREDYDNICPIEVRPAPTEMARVGIVLTELP